MWKNANETANKWKNMFLICKFDTEILQILYYICFTNENDLIFDRYWFMHNILFKVAASFDFDICRNACYIDILITMPSLNRKWMIFAQLLDCLCNIATDIIESNCEILWVSLLYTQNIYRVKHDFTIQRRSICFRCKFLIWKHCHIWKLTNECTTICNLLWLKWLDESLINRRLQLILP